MITVICHKCNILIGQFDLEDARQFAPFLCPDCAMTELEKLMDENWSDENEKEKNI